MPKPLTYDRLLERLKAFEDGAPPPSRYLVAFSGGVDSTVLLHALVSTSGRHGVPVVAIHIDHGLHVDSADWEAHCRRIAQAFEVPYLTRKVTIGTGSGIGIEAAAREARYGVLRALMQSGDWLLSAHHENDQAETLLLNLFRGSGVSGLAGIGKIRPFGSGRLVRPMLGISVDAIAACARQYGLEWIDDPSNEDTRFDRNFLRQEILPLLTSRWPSVSGKIRQTAELAGEASDLLRDLAIIDLASLGQVNRLQITGLKSLSGARQRNVIRHSIRSCGLPPAPATRLYQVVTELLPARVDAQPRVTWPGGEMRRYREFLYILAPADQDDRAGDLHWEPVTEALELGPGQGRLELLPTAAGGLSAELLRHGLTIRYRRGGEEIRPFGQNCRYKLKKLLQQHSVVPWMRGRIPLLYAGDELIAVGDLFMANNAVESQGFVVVWNNGPALY